MFLSFSSAFYKFLNWLKFNYQLSTQEFESYSSFELIAILGNGELLELRLLETGFLSRFQLNP